MAYQNTSENNGLESSFLFLDDTDRSLYILAGIFLQAFIRFVAKRNRTISPPAHVLMHL